MNTQVCGLSEDEIAQIEDIVRVTFNDKQILVQAFTHPSSTEVVKSFERLEFLGDAVISEVVATYLVDNHSLNPREMTNIRSMTVSTDHLSRITKTLGLDYFLVVCNGNNPKLGKSIKSLCDVFEAVVGAIRRDQGYEIAAEFIIEHLKERLEAVAATDFVNSPKVQLERLMRVRFGVSVVYLYAGYRRMSIGRSNHQVWQVFAVEDPADADNPEKLSLLGTGDGAHRDNAQASAAAYAIRWLIKEGFTLDLILGKV